MTNQQAIRIIEIDANIEELSLLLEMLPINSRMIISDRIEELKNEKYYNYLPKYDTMENTYKSGFFALD